MLSLIKISLKTAQEMDQRKGDLYGWLSQVLQGTDVCPATWECSRAVRLSEED